MYPARVCNAIDLSCKTYGSRCCKNKCIERDKTRCTRKEKCYTVRPYICKRIDGKKSVQFSVTLVLDNTEY